MSTPSDPYATGPADQGPPAGQAPPPGYGPPPPGYGQPPGYPPPGYPPAGYGAGAWVGGQAARPTNTLAIVSLVLIFFFTPAALITGIIGRNQIKQTGEGGSWMALTGIICGALSIAFLVFVFSAVAVFVGSADTY